MYHDCSTMHSSCVWHWPTVNEVLMQKIAPVSRNESNTRKHNQKAPQGGWRSSPPARNSHDSFPRRKFENRAQASCRLGPILSRPTIRFELYAKMAEEIDLENTIFAASEAPWPWHWPWIEVILVRMCGRGLSTHQSRSKSEKLFVDVRTDGHTWVPIY